MGTRADFYIGKGLKSEWLGSIAWDGYPEPYEKKGMWEPCDEEAWRERIHKFAKMRDDWTSPDMGWPWPWNTSATTDYAYTWKDGLVWISNGCKWLAYDDYRTASAEYQRLYKIAEASEDPVWPNENWWEDLGPGATFPDMSERQNVTLGPRSGVLVLGVR